MTGDARFTLLDSASKPARAEIEIRRSRFIAEAAHCSSWQQAAKFIEQVRSRNPKARHVVHAGTWAGSPDSPGTPSERMNDDGEPSGTAGKPVLRAITMRGMTDCIVTVTRYFGGILLGSSGLVRAYASAASAALACARLASLVPCQRLGLVVGYAEYEPCLRIIASCDGIANDEHFSETVHLSVTIPQQRLGEFKAAFAQRFPARPTPSMLGQPLNQAIPVIADRPMHP